MKLMDRASVKDVIKEMTLEEKALLITGQFMYGTEGIERLGIPRAMFLDAGGGVNLRQYMVQLISTGQLTGTYLEKAGKHGLGLIAYMTKIMNNLTSRENLSEEENELLDAFLEKIRELVPSGDLPSCFPDGMLLGATWNPDAVLHCAEAVGKEASAFGVDMLLGTPCINIHRNPLGGRSFESYSEDPYLISELAPNYCIGVQNQGVIADVKHCAANTQEPERESVNEIISKRALYEIYFPGFKACVQKGGVKNVMTAYNYINGNACAHNSWLIRDVLRGEWGFDGFVVSDWGGVYDQVEALKAGNDLSEPGPRDTRPIIDAVKEGRLDEACLDEAVEHYLNVLVEMPVMKGRKYHDIDSEKSREIAYETACEGITLLKNDGVLPLSVDTRISFYGEKSKHFLDCGIGSGRVHTDKTSSLIDCSRQIVGDEKILVSEMSDLTDVVIISAAAAGQEGCDREDMKLDAEDQKLVLETVREAKKRQKKVVLILNISAPVEMMDYIDDVNAVLCVYFPGEEGGHAASDILFGKRNPCGKLPLTFPKYYRDCPSYLNFPGEFGEVLYGEGIYAGYRYYDVKQIEPLFPFGYGLSYTTFEFQNMSLSSGRLNIDNGETVQVKVTVKNTGNMAGSEVVQLYIHDQESTLQKAVKELKGFQKVFLNPGESKEVTMTIGKEQLSSYDPYEKDWVCEPGIFILLAGNSSRNIYLKKSLLVEGTNVYGYGPNTLFKRINDDERAVKILLEGLPEGVIDRTVLKNYNNTLPFQPFEKVWEKEIVPRMHNKTEAEISAMFLNICGLLKRLDVTASEKKYIEDTVY